MKHSFFLFYYSLLFCLISLNFRSVLAEETNTSSIKETTITEITPSQKVSSTQDITSDFDQGPFGKERKHLLGIGLGQTFLAGKYAQFGKDQITFDLLYQYKASDSFDFMSIIGLSEHTLEKKGTEFSQFGIALGIKGRPFILETFSPYIFAGPGFYLPRFHYLDTSGRKVSTDPRFTFGVAAGAGIELFLNQKIAIGLLALFQKPFNVDQENGINVEGSYFKLLFTTSYRF